jgi:hypothetical protein
MRHGIQRRFPIFYWKTDDRHTEMRSDSENAFIG